MIFECIVTTINSDRSIQISPMGPEVNDLWTEFELRPFEPSKTLENLDRNRSGVIHIFDRALIFAEAVVNRPISSSDYRDAEKVDGMILNDSCRAFEFEVTSLHRAGNRASVQCRVVAEHNHRPYDGMNRARNAIVEASILASRIMFIPAETITDQFQMLKPIVQRTGSIEEVNAFQLLCDHVNEKLWDGRDVV
jgi:uncharacterized protein